MKKIILTAAALFALSFANAQEARFGIKAGLNMATMTNIDDSEMKAGFHAGGFVQIMLNEQFAIQPELLYSTQGIKAEDLDAGFNLSYLNIPVMAKYFANEKFSIEAGPQIGFLMSAKLEVEGDSADVKEIFNTTDVGLNFGAGYDFTENISAGIRYNLGLSTLQKDLGDDEDASKNSVFQISLGYKF